MHTLRALISRPHVLALPFAEEFVEVPDIVTFEVESEMWKARVRLAVHSAYTQHNSSNVHIRLLPTKSVIATASARSKALKLIPLSMVVVAVKDSDSQTLPTIRTVFKHPVNNEAYGLMLGTPKLAVEKPKFAKEGSHSAAPTSLFGPAFWFVEISRDQAQANMASSSVKVLCVFVDAFM